LPNQQIAQASSQSVRIFRHYGTSSPDISQRI
jgi:hypothetical protein